VTGYLVAKIDRIFDVAMKQDENVNGRFVGRLLLFVSVFATRPWQHICVVMPR
jgi:hypothetical protein